MRASTFLCLGVGSFMAAGMAGPSAIHRPRILSPPEVTVEYKPLEKEFTLHEPVVVLFSVHNGFSQLVTLSLGAQRRQFFGFSLTTPNGALLKSANRPGWDFNTITFGTESMPEVAPGTDYELPLVMNQWFEFKSAGPCFLAATLSTEISISSGGTLSPKPQNIQLRVGPRDAVHLEKLCAELAKQMEEAPGVAEWRNTALRLSYVEDPIAVPHLRQALSMHKGAEYLLIPGWERIGDDAAIHVLLSALIDKSGEVGLLARQALTRMNDRIEIQTLKGTVELALAPKHNAFLNVMTKEM